MTYTHIIGRNLTQNTVDDSPEHIFFISLTQQLLVGQNLVHIEASRSPSVWHTTLGMTLLSYSIGTGSLSGIKRGEGGWRWPSSFHLVLRCFHLQRYISPEFPWTLQMGLVRHALTLVTICQPKLLNIPEDRKPQLFCGGSLKPRLNIPLLILVNNQLDALSLMYLFILPLYMFRTAQCSSSGDQMH